MRIAKSTQIVEITYLKKNRRDNKILWETINERNVVKTISNQIEFCWKSKFYHLSCESIFFIDKIYYRWIIWNHNRHFDYVFLILQQFRFAFVDAISIIIFDNTIMNLITKTILSRFFNNYDNTKSNVTRNCSLELLSKKYKILIKWLFNICHDFISRELRSILWTNYVAIVQKNSSFIYKFLLESNKINKSFSRYEKIIIVIQIICNSRV